MHQASNLVQTSPFMKAYIPQQDKLIKVPDDVLKQELAHLSHLKVLLEGIGQKSKPSSQIPAIRTITMSVAPDLLQGYLESLKKVQ